VFAWLLLVSNVLTQLEPHLITLTMIGFRLSGLFIFAPILASVAIPGRVKVLFCSIMAIAIWPMVPVPAVLPQVDLISLALASIVEVIVGSLIGLFLMLPIMAVQLGGTLVSQQMGFSLATIYNPTVDAESDVVADLLLHIAMGAFLLLGGLETLFLVTTKSFSHLPIGSFTLSEAPLTHITNLLSSGFELALRVALPVIGLILVETVATAMLMKTIPQINIMSIGFATKIVLGFIGLIAGLYAIDAAIQMHIQDGWTGVGEWLRSFASHRSASHG
jgi:flagellar biosynthesis protein FliR